MKSRSLPWLRTDGAIDSLDVQAAPDARDVERSPGGVESPRSHLEHLAPCTAMFRDVPRCTVFTLSSKMSSFVYQKARMQMEAIGQAAPMKLVVVCSKTKPFNLIELK